MKKQKLQEMLESQNASIDADMVRVLYYLMVFRNLRNLILFDMDLEQ